MKHLILLLLSCLSLAVSGKDNDLLVAMYNNANQAYAEKEYETAKDLYEQILSTGHASFELEYNLGCTYFKLGNPTLAALHFERAKLKYPGNKDVLFNLELIRSMQADKIDVIPELAITSWWNRAIMYFSADKLAWGSILTISLAVVAFMLYRIALEPNRKRLWFSGSMLLLLATIGIWGLAYVQLNRLTAHKTALVIMPSVTVKSSPDQDATKLFVIHEGLKVEILDRLSDWYEIELPDGKVGWLQKSMVAEI